ncbi:phage tail protein [Providencia rettgeri]|nr:phage tail protein [Providencia rettgeri]QLI99153.1 phage tail protein [Providencia rettgeri]
MKYFALLTKLGENLLAQATALGTKLELTHMAVGDGGGSLPTPDTNQTKLIAEKRRAAINTLFIDDKNKNQIIAEQIIPEQDGGWWIREIGLFDKAGNLIAVANCPETYKPQLAEGSGRTQSIRMVLIVSHTESVTLKIDPSVVLATREYVNTEITVLDKKIDALSAQTKLDLNKKFDKANISGQKGNDNDKVPSLNLFTTEIGKLAVIGYSYSKIESDGRYQPKGNYAPAGDYATNTALNNGLDKKFDKTGGSISGNVTAEGDVASKFNSYIVKLETRGGKTGIVSSTDNQRYYTHTLQEKSGTLMHLGDGGWMSDTGAVFGGISLLSDYRLNSIGYAYSASQTDTYQKTNHHFLNVFGYVNRNYGVQLAFTNNGRVGFRNIENNTAKEWADFYTTINTTIDRNGCLKVAGTSNELSDFPVGSPIPWPQATAPTGFLVCNGQTFNKTTYPLLAVAYPSGKLPDLRSEFIRGLDAGRNVDSGRTVLSAQSDAMQNITGEIGWGENGLFTIANGVFTPTQSTTNRIASAGDAGTSVSRAKFEASNQARTANENRPRNIAFLYIVRAA